MNKISNIVSSKNHVFSSSVEENNDLLNGFNTENSLLVAAFPLIKIFMHLKFVKGEVNLRLFQKRIIEEIKLFTKRAKTMHCQPQLILAANYCLCTALDEAILMTTWGAASGWAQQSLLSVIHHETWGGERFFIILEKMAEEPKKNLILLELLYLLLALGFEGKYYNEERMLREDLQNRLYKLISFYRPEFSPSLTPDAYLEKKVPLKSISNKRFFLIILSALLIMGIFFNVILYFKSKPFLQELNDLDNLSSGYLLSQHSKNGGEVYGNGFSRPHYSIGKMNFYYREDKP
jgi:type VI secretion system protein ImpK